MSVSNAPEAPGAPLPGPVVVTEADRARLLELARLAIAVAVHARPDADLRAAMESSPLPGQLAGAFVTLTERAELRGCMGTLDDSEPAWASVVHAARMAALGDPRFYQVSAAEFGRLHVEVSILGPMCPLPDPSRFRPGIDGLLISRGGRRGLLLPEVADMLEPTHDAMLEAVCHKAGLPTDAWRDPRTELLAFRTCRFGGPAT